MIKMSLGSRLKYQREKRNWSQKYVADKIGITNSVLSNYERDYRDPDTKTLKALAELYDCTTDWLIGHAEHPTETEDEFMERMIKEGTLAFHDYESLSEEDIETVKNEIKKEMKKQVEYMVWRKMQEKKK